jgi:hypothetical protein
VRVNLRGAVELSRRRADTLREWAQEAAISRLYAGIHFPTDTEAAVAPSRGSRWVLLAADGRGWTLPTGS